jgi:hypothetical protein
MEPAHNFPVDDSNDKAFVHATTTIGGHDIVEEVLYSEIWPLGSGLGFIEVVEAEPPMSKVLVPLPKFVIAKPDADVGEDFVARVGPCG